MAGSDGPSGVASTRHGTWPRPGRGWPGFSVSLRARSPGRPTGRRRVSSGPPSPAGGGPAKTISPIGSRPDRQDPRRHLHRGPGGEEPGEEPPPGEVDQRRRLGGTRKPAAVQSRVVRGHPRGGPRFFASTKTCSSCGWVNQEMTLADRVFACECCGLVVTVTPTRPPISPPGARPSIARSPRPRTPKHGAGSPKPVEGGALAVTSMTVQLPPRPRIPGRSRNRSPPAG